MRKGYFSVAIAIITIFFLPVSLWGLTLEVYLEPQVSLNQENITLGDIARISYPLPEGEKVAELTELGVLSPSQPERVITAQEIYNHLCARGIPQLDYIYFSGAMECRVRLQGQWVSVVQLEGEIGDEIRKRFEFVKRLEVRLASPEQVFLPDGCEYRISLPTSFNPWGSVTAELDILSSEGEVVSKLPLRLEIRAFRNVVRAKETLKRGEVIDASSVYVVEEVLDYRNFKALDDPTKVVGKVARRNINQGELITPSSFEEEALVQRGDLVTMVARNGGITVTALGKARSDGALGEVIIVENLDSRKRVQGRIIGERMVEVAVK
ncbi:flagellar basal body P-ring formation chaperone FlgA [Atrimonas thermophila]|uniref:flagellar basal body P-ring formation chaperone FlgA n=1 Tax=Atrimonas thermophila TaxID=3064161 RepID=UPI00399C91C1